MKPTKCSTCKLNRWQRVIFREQANGEVRRIRIRSCGCDRKPTKDLRTIEQQTMIVGLTHKYYDHIAKGEL